MKRLTPLREQVLNVFLKQAESLTAYEALAKLKKLRPSAEPATIYRAIDYLIGEGLLHKVDATNQFIACRHNNEKSPLHQGLLFTCTLCKVTCEYISEEIFSFINLFAKKNHIKAEHSLLALSGICEKCS